jgi:hypothetical protein
MAIQESFWVVVFLLPETKGCVRARLQPCRGRRKIKAALAAEATNFCRNSPRQKFSHVAQDLKQHRVRKLASKCILLTRMVRRKQARQIPRQLVASSMPKRKRSQLRDEPALFQLPQVSPHRDAAQHQHRARPQNFELALQKVTAIRQLRRQRFIRRRRAAHRGSHIYILQLEAVVAICGSRLVGKARAIQRLVQKIAGAVSGEYSPRAVAAMCSGRKTQNQKLGARIAEARNRLAPVVPREEGAALVPRDLFAVPYKSRARATVNDFPIQLFQFAQAAVSLKSYHEPSQARQASKQHAARALRRSMATIAFARAMPKNEAARQSRRHELQSLVVCGRIRSSSSAQKTSESTNLDG